MKKIVLNNLNTNYNSLTNHQKCCLRDRAILESLQNMKVLNTDQVAVLFFEGRLKVTQRRLGNLFKRKRVKRKDIAPNQPYCYYVDTKPPEQIMHTIMVNWIFIWFKVNLKSYESIFHFSYEQQNEVFRYDALIAIENKFTQEIRFYFIEVDISNNKFDKVKLYTKFYQERLYERQWWVKYIKRFPGIIVLTHRKKGVESKIQEDNYSGLEFKVYGLELVDEMKSMLK